MQTIQDVKAHPLFPLFGARFDNHDAAYALGIPNFTDFRKMLERDNLLSFPRRDENPARPRYRLGHIYEFAMLDALARMTTKKTAAAVFRYFIEPHHHEVRLGNNAWQKISPDLKKIIQSNNSFESWDSDGDKTNPDPNGLHLFVDHPWFAFGKLLDRSEEAMSKPYSLAIAPDVGADHYQDRVEFSVVALTADATMNTILNELNSVRQNYLGVWADFQSAHILNVVGLFARIEKKLLLRVQGRELMGSDG